MVWLIAVIERLDGGSSKVPGEFVCTVEGCKWTRKGIKVETAYQHVRHHHHRHMASIGPPRFGLSEAERKQRKHLSEETGKRKKCKDGAVEGNILYRLSF